MTELVLSLFPGIGLLDMAFEEEDFCLVRGPDPLWGGDIRKFHPPAGKFDGVIGGPPCQAFSKLRHLVKANGLKSAENLIPEFERCVLEARPVWFLMENVEDAPIPSIAGYRQYAFLLDNHWIGGEQRRKRRFTFGCEQRRIDLREWIDYALLEDFRSAQGVCASGGVKPGIPTGRKVRGRYLGWKTAAALKESIQLQGLPPDFCKAMPFTLEGKHRVVGNGVPLPMGRAIAKAVKRALERNDS